MGNKNIGLFACFVVSMYPNVFGMSRIATLDFPLTAMVAFSLCCLLYTANFDRRIPSLLFGFSMGLGLLTKEAFLFFIYAPFLFVVFVAFYRGGDSAGRRAVNLFLALTVTIILAGPWYFPKLNFLLPNYIRAGYTDGHLFGPARIFSLDSFTYYLRQLVRAQILLFFSFLFFFSAVLFFRRKTYLKGYLLSSILGPYIILTLVNAKAIKETLPYLVVFALISAAGIVQIKAPQLKRVLISIIILFGLTQYFVLSYYYTIPFSYIRRIPVFKMFTSSYNYEVFGGPVFPRPGNYHADEIFSLLEKEGDSYRNVIVGISALSAVGYAERGLRWYENNLLTNWYTIRYFCRLKRLSYSIVSLDERLYKGSWWEGLPTLPDFLITVSEIEDSVPKAASEKYEFIQRFTMPDGSYVYVYKKRFREERQS